MVRYGRCINIASDSGEKHRHLDGITCPPAVRGYLQLWRPYLAFLGCCGQFVGSGEAQLPVGSGQNQLPVDGQSFGPVQLLGQLWCLFLYPALDDEKKCAQQLRDVPAKESRSFSRSDYRFLLSISTT